MTANATVKATRREKRAGKPRKKGVLVIVESPAKARTIEGYLGPDYRVLASMGPLIDLPKSRLGIDIEHGFQPEFLTIRGKATLLKELVRAARKSRLVLLAPDDDREGEAISWHVRETLHDKLPCLSVERITFAEITPEAVAAAVKSPRPIDAGLVESQMARRVLDRLVGYNLSPLLWKKVKNGLSAGRVQSVALRLVCERERELQAFLPEEYWRIEARFRKGRSLFSGDLISWKGGNAALLGEAEAQGILESIQDAPFVVRDARISESVQESEPPFTTARLQQVAAERLGFSGKKTMQIAQQLYEGVDLGEVRLGLITFMRSDSLRVSDAALTGLRSWLAERFPAELPALPRVHFPPGKSDEVHEAIRPTTLERHPDSLKDHLTRDQQRLYALVWERFVASQMTGAKSRKVDIEVVAMAADGREAIFLLTSSLLVERGFRKVFKVTSSKKEAVEKPLPELALGETLRKDALLCAQRFTEGPLRYSDATIVKALEDAGIGRPSTYAPIVSALLERHYVARDNRWLVPTMIGRMIDGIMADSFSDFLDVGYTAEMEAALDRVGEGHRDWPGMIGAFWKPFKARVDEVMEKLQSAKGSLDEATDLVCEKCGKPLVKKLGRYGYFLACTGFPACMNTRSVPLAPCPRPGCDGQVVVRHRSGTARAGAAQARTAKTASREFYGCSRYPDCDFITDFKPVGEACPLCGQLLVEKFDKKRGAFEACINPACEYLHVQAKEREHGSAD